MGPCHLRIIVLTLLEKEQLSGYTLIKRIQECAKGWKPSTGSIYPLLIKLKKEKVLDAHEVGRSNIYTITQKGKEEIVQIRNKRQEIISAMLSGICIGKMMLSKKDNEHVYLEIKKIYDK